MIFSKYLIIFFLATVMFAQMNEVDNLLEKVNQAPTSKQKKELIEKLKQKLAITNKKAREVSDAIIKAKQKIPIRIYNDTKFDK